jgi:flagellar motor switch protein FliN/FliY
MSTETQGFSMPDDIRQAATSETAQVGSSPDESEDVRVESPEFQEMPPSVAKQNSRADLNRFQEIKVTVSADLGRAQVPLQTLMNLGEGSVLELNREIDSPVELVAQGVALACGEVVVVNGCFAVRVTKVYEGKQGIKD